MADAFAAALAEHIKNSANTWVRYLENVPGESRRVPGGEARVGWQDDGTAIVEDVAGDRHGPYRVTVLVEPAESWKQVTWKDLPPLLNGHNPAPVYVELGGVRAQVFSATEQRWHVDPNSPDRYPRPMEHDVISVRLLAEGAEASKVYRMPPNGPVMMLENSPVGPAVDALLAGGFDLEAIPDETG